MVLGPLAGCVPPIAANGEPNSVDDVVPDFSVVDVNPSSARYEEAVSPRDYLGGISAWYFGHST
jgi:hypothetical protein